MDLLVPPSKREKDTVMIREDVNGGIKVNICLTLWSSQAVKMGLILIIKRLHSLNQIAGLKETTVRNEDETMKMSGRWISRKNYRGNSDERHIE